MNKMSRQKFKYLKKEKAFFIVLKDFHWSTLKQFFLEGEGPTLNKQKMVEQILEQMVGIHSKRTCKYIIQT